MWSTVTQFGWVDAVDVLIIAFVAYQLLLMFKGTRALQMILGLALVYLASRIALKGGLLTVNWVLQNSLGVWFLMIIVLFQPELRRALATFGLRSRLLRAVAGREEAYMIDEIVRSAASMASKKIGALMVLERETKLSDYIDSGVALDARVSRRLIESIFYPGSPLHDGAAVIQGGRVVAASCLLPLTLADDISEDLGTRHRAAIGLTEETDAIAIVVSEEMGSVSLVHGGAINTGLDAQRLRRQLGELLGSPGSGGSSPTSKKDAIAPSAIGGQPLTGG
ncbi:MAG: TIGR00159 family protein [Candidatus Methylomirabilota bacterium]|nr:MAG: TIGR00159 family protein [candidate division NC10 bacterium]